MNYNHLKGWLLSKAVDLDLKCPGVAGHILRASDERRQIIAAVLSRAEPEAYDHALGQLIQTASHVELIHLAFGSVPHGYRRALGRVGVHIQPPRFYFYLWAVFSSSERIEMARAVMRLKRVTWPRMRILRALSPDLRHPELIDAISDPQQARDVCRLVEMLFQNGANRSEMSLVLNGARTQQAISSFARKWSMKLAFPPHPVPASGFYIPVETGEQLQRSARRFRNCSRSHLARVLEGRSSFAELHIPQGAAVVHLIKNGDRWLLEDVYGPSNDPPAAGVEEAAEKYLMQFGIGRSKPVIVDSPWAALRRLTGRFDFEF